MPLAKRYHTEESMRAALAFFEQGHTLDSLKKGDEHPVEVLSAVIDEVLERRAWIESFRNKITEWYRSFNQH